MRHVGIQETKYSRLVFGNS